MGMVRISVMFSSVLCASMLIMAQASYAETVSIGSGHTNTRELGGNSKYAQRKARARRIKSHIKQQHKKVEPVIAATVIAKADTAKLVASVPILAIKPLPLEMVTVRPVMNKAVIVKLRPVVANPVKVVTKGVLEKSPVVQSPVVQSPVVKISNSVSPALKKSSPVVAKIATVTMVLPPLAKPMVSGIFNKPTAKPVKEKPASPLVPVSVERTVYENYIEEIRQGKAFRATVERYSSDNKKTSMLRLFNQSKDMQDMTIKQIRLSQKCTGLTFIKQRQLSPYLIKISYAAKDVCSKYSNNKRFEVVEMINEDNSWKIEKITVTNVIE